MYPEALIRFVVSRTTPLSADRARSFLQDQIPPAVYRNPLGDHDFWVNTPVSKTLLPAFFREVQLPLSKAAYYLIAEQMLPEEIPTEVKNKLDRMAESFGIERLVMAETALP